MKKVLFYLLPAFVLLGSCSKYVADFKTTRCASPQENTGYSRAAELEKALDELVQKGVPGVVLAVQSDEGFWATAKGYARIEDKTPMQLCHLQYLQSISKTYMKEVWTVFLSILRPVNQSLMHYRNKMQKN